MLACARLYAHALTLLAWAAFAALFGLEGTTIVIVLMCATIGCAAVVAERERARRRRGRRA